MTRVHKGLESLAKLAEEQPTAMWHLTDRRVLEYCLPIRDREFGVPDVDH
jgi:hypothetical protein